MIFLILILVRVYDDGIFFSIDTDQMNAINGIVSGRDLQLFTRGGEF